MFRPLAQMTGCHRVPLLLDNFSYFGYHWLTALVKHMFHKGGVLPNLEIASPRALGNNVFPHNGNVDSVVMVVTTLLCLC